MEFALEADGLSASQLQYRPEDNVQRGQTHTQIPPHSHLWTEATAGTIDLEVLEFYKISEKESQT